MYLTNTFKTKIRSIKMHVVNLCFHYTQRNEQNMKLVYNCICFKKKTFPAVIHCEKNDSRFKDR